MQYKLIATFLILCSSLHALGKEQLHENTQITCFIDLRDANESHLYSQKRADLVYTNRVEERGLSKLGISYTSSIDDNSYFATATYSQLYSHFHLNRDLVIENTFTHFHPRMTYFGYTNSCSAFETALCKNIDLGKHKFCVGLSASAALETNKILFYALPRFAYLYEFSEGSFLSVGYVDRSLLRAPHASDEWKFTTKLKLAEVTHMYQNDQFVPLLKNEIALAWEVSSFYVELSTGISATSSVDIDPHSLKSVTNTPANPYLLLHIGIAAQVSW